MLGIRSEKLGKLPVVIENQGKQSRKLPRGSYLKKLGGLNINYFPFAITQWSILV